MPGVFGASRKDRRESVSGLMDRMAASLKGDSPARVDRYVDEDGGTGLGRVGLGIFESGEQSAADASGRYRVVFHGELYNNPGSSTDAEYVLSLFLKHGEACASALNGVFHFVVHDGESGRIRLYADKFGLSPLYYSVLPDGIVFAGSVRAILEEPSVSRRWDCRSFGDFFHFGQILGDKTLFESVSLAPPGSVVVYDPDRGEGRVEPYWELDGLFAENGRYDAAVSVDDVVSSLLRSIEARSQSLDMLGLSLSGGLDSRAVLAGLGGKARGLSTYTLGVPGCADQKLAARMSEAAGTRHEFVPLEQGYLEDFQSLAQRMIFLSDGMYHPHESTEMLALDYFKRAPFRILLRGHGGEIAKAALAYPVMVTPSVFSLPRGRAVLDSVFRATNLVLRDVEPRNLFTPGFQSRIEGAARESLEASCGGASERLAPADLHIYYYIKEHIRRQVVASLEIFRSRIEVRLPYVDEDYVKLLLRLPVSRRNRGEIHYALIRRCMPALMRIPDSNTGTLPDAPPLKAFLMDKINSVMRRLKVEGFRHYTEFQDWQRKAFRKTTEAILFSPRTAERDLYDPRGLRRVFEEHASGGKNYAHLLGTMVGLELWLRHFVDG